MERGLEGLDELLRGREGDTYPVSVHCGSCGWSGVVRMPRGMKTTGFLGSNLPRCPHCDCDDLGKAWS